MHNVYRQAIGNRNKCLCLQRTSQNFNNIPSFSFILNCCKYDHRQTTHGIHRPGWTICETHRQTHPLNKGWPQLTYRQTNPRDTNIFTHGIQTSLSRTNMQVLLYTWPACPLSNSCRLPPLSHADRRWQCFVTPLKLSTLLYWKDCSTCEYWACFAL